MSNPDKDRGDLLKPHFWLIRLIGVIVPRRLRADWRQEWEAELNHREMLLSDWDRLNWRSKLDLLWRSTSAFWDAIWLQSYRWEDEMIQDLRFGVRMLLKQPGFTLIAVLTLALGIGANTAIFSVVNALLLRPLPYAESERLVLLSERSREGERLDASYPNFADWRARAQSFVGMAATYTRNFNLTGVEKPARLQVRLGNWNFFQLLGVNPQLGRLFTEADDHYGASTRVSDCRMRNEVESNDETGDPVKLHLWLIVWIGVIVPRRLAARVGSGVSLPRAAACRVGQARLADET